MIDRSAENKRLVAALAYAKRGWRVLPCVERDKRPATKHGYKDATSDRGKLVTRWKSNPRANVAVATGAGSGLVVLDVDPRNGGNESLARLQREHGQLPETATVETGGGGRHYYFTDSTECGTPSYKLADGLDVKANGGYVLAPPSLHPSGKRYRWERPQRRVPPAPAPDWILRGAPTAREQGALPSGGASTAAETPLGRMFGKLGLLGRTLDEGKCAVVCPWESAHTTGKPLDSSTVIFPASEPGGLGGFYCAHSHCAGRSAQEAYDELRRRTRAQSAEQSWMAELARNVEGKVLRTFRNVCLILEHDAAYGANLRFNEMSSTVLLASDEMRDSTISAIRLDLDARYGLAPSEADAVRAVQYVAEQNSFHPVRAYLQGLEWDGQPRIERVATEILNVVANSPEEQTFLNLLLRRWFIGAVARPLQPGVKLDTVLILVGRQGAGKSTFFRLLAGEWFSDSEMALDKDGLMLLGGSWIYEWAELENVVGRNTTSRVKQFVTSVRDRYRPPFGRATITVPRTSVIVGTTNQDAFLHDPTGSRRFWAIPIGTVNEPLLREWRDQLWAEAVAAYEKLKPHWLSDREEAMRQEFVSQFDETDPWEGPILTYAQKLQDVRLAELLERVLEIPLDRRTPRDQQRVVAILRRNGWESVQRRTEEGKRRLWQRRGRR